jgi:hypothetical protein
MDLTDLRIGADRFLALKWANYAFELSQTDQDPDRLYGSLREYLDYEIEGEVSSRKTSNQLKRLWLVNDDRFHSLRKHAMSLPVDRYPEYLPLLHLGMAMAVFPVYRETIRAIGSLHRLIQPIPKQSVSDRVLETFGNRSSIPRIVVRVIQTLADWQIIDVTEGSIEIKIFSIKNDDFKEWFVSTLVDLYSETGLSIAEFNLVPEKLNFEIDNLREIIQNSSILTLKRDIDGREVIRTKYPA